MRFHLHMTSSFDSIYHTSRMKYSLAKFKLCKHQSQHIWLDALGKQIPVSMWWISQDLDYSIALFRHNENEAAQKPESEWKANDQNERFKFHSAIVRGHHKQFVKRA